MIKRAFGLFKGLQKPTLRKLIRTEYVYKACRTESATKGLSGEAYDIRIVSSEIDSDIAASIDSDPERDKVKRRIAEGGIAALVFDKDKIIAYGFATQVERIFFSYVGQYVYLPEPGFYIYDCVTRERYRRKGLYRLMLRELSRFLGEYDVYVACQGHNRASVAGIRKEWFFFYRRIVTVDLLLLTWQFHLRR